MHAPISVPCLATLAAYLQRSLALNSPTLPCDSQSQRNTHLAVIYHRSDLELTHLALPILADHALQHSPCTYPSPCLALQHSLCTTHHQHVTYLMCLPTHSLCHMIIAPPAQHITYSLCRSPSLALTHMPLTHLTVIDMGMQVAIMTTLLLLGLPCFAKPPCNAHLNHLALTRPPITHSPCLHILTLMPHSPRSPCIHSSYLAILTLPNSYILMSNQAVGISL